MYVYRSDHGVQPAPEHMGEDLPEASPYPQLPSPPTLDIQTEDDKKPPLRETLRTIMEELSNIWT